MGAGKTGKKKVEKIREKSQKILEKLWKK